MLNVLQFAFPRQSVYLEGNRSRAQSQNSTEDAKIPKWSLSTKQLRYYMRRESVWRQNS